MHQSNRIREPSNFTVFLLATVSEHPERAGAVIIPIHDLYDPFEWSQIHFFSASRVAQKVRPRIKQHIQPVGMLIWLRSLSENGPQI
jgi:hypothetical protein